MKNCRTCNQTKPANAECALRARLGEKEQR